jgi:hypothetical protein
MKVGILLLILRDVINGLLRMNLLSTAGEFVAPTLDQDLAIAAMVEQAAKAHGVVVQAEVDKIINALPLVLSLVR